MSNSEQNGQVVSLDDRVAQLSTLVEKQSRMLQEQSRILEEQRERLGSLESQSDEPSGSAGNGKRSRRDLMKMATLGALGAGGAIALRSLPASAASGGAMTLGFVNDANNTTTLKPTASSSPNPLLSLDNSAAAGAIALFVTGSNNANESVFVQSAGNSHGIISFAGPSGTTFAGLYGSANGGYGLAAYSTTGIDIYGGGTGRLGMIPNAAGGSGAPNFTPGAGTLELLREDDGTIWASRAAGANPIGTLKGAWKRVNTVRVDSASGDGSAFAPARLIDTRDGTGGVTGQLQPNTTTTFGPFNGRNGIPSDAVGIVGNLSAIGFSGAGYMTMFPTGTTQPGIASVQFGGGLFSIGNGFTAGFGTGANAGKISIYVSNNVPTHCTLDVTGYIQ